MKVQRVYIDTSVIGGCFDPEFAPWSNGLMKDFRLGNFRPVFYQERDVLSPKYYNDGLHIALATIAEVNVLVSWNFKHIVHFEKIRLFSAINMEQGYRPLQIYSPREVTNYEEGL